VLPIYDLGFDPASGMPRLLMKLIEGQTLGNLFRERRVVRRWIAWYNERRPHQAFGYLSPRQYRASQLQRVV